MVEALIQEMVNDLLNVLLLCRGYVSGFIRVYDNFLSLRLCLICLGLSFIRFIRGMGGSGVRSICGKRLFGVCLGSFHERFVNKQYNW